LRCENPDRRERELVASAALSVRDSVLDALRTTKPLE
jgi:hypothetical protein